MRYLLKNLLLLIGILHASSMMSQKYTYAQFTKDSLNIIKPKLVRPQFKLDNRIAFHGSQGLDINGFDVGVLLSNKLRVTLGYYGMKANLKEFSIVKEGVEYGRTIEMNYGSLNTELIYKDWRFFSLGMPFEIAGGTNTIREKNVTTSEVIAKHTGGLLFFNFGVSGTFKPMRFIGLKAIFGYRKVAFNQVNDFNFDGFFTSIGLNVDLHEILTGVRMYKLKKKYRHGDNLRNAVDVITE